MKEHGNFDTLIEAEENDPNTFRECSMLFLQVFFHAVALMPDSPEKWGVAFATSNPICMGKSMSEIAEKLGVSRATISVIARKFCSELGLPPSTYMKSENASQAARQARNNYVKQKQK